MLVASLAAPAVASADSVLVRIHGVGAVRETTPLGAINCDTGLTVGGVGLTPTSTVECRNTTNYGRFFVVELTASVPAAYAALGWKFSHWTEGTGGRQVNCDDQPASNRHVCKFLVNGADGEQTLDLHFIDDAAPSLTLGAGGPAQNSITSQTTAQFAFSSTDPTARFECRVDNQAAAPCNAGTFSTTPGQGTHTFVVQARDPAGNLSSAASRTWTIDSVAPVTTLAAGGPVQNSFTNATTATFSYSTNEPGATLQCTYDGNAAWQTCPSPHTRTNVPNGARSFSVRSIDAAGNISAAVTRNWTVDTVAPTAALLSGPTAGQVSNSATATFTFNANDGSGLQCRVDGTDANFTACTSPYTTAPLSQGAHTFFVRAVDAAGNVSGIVTRTWTVDTVFPTLTLTAGPANASATQQTTATFSFGSDAGTQCRVDNGAFAACSSPFTTAALADGSHTFTVRATDTAGNVTEQARTWLVDTIAPSFVFTSGPAAGQQTENTSAVFAYQVGDASDPNGLTVECRLDDAPIACTRTAASLTSLGEGQHTFSVLVRDRAGNARADARSWIVDSRAPTVTLEAGPVMNSAVNEPPIFRWRADEEATFTCKLDAGAPQPCTPPFTMPGLRDGFHTVVIASRDKYGHVSEVTRSFTLDTVAPDTVIVDGPGENTTVSNLFTTFLFDAGEPVTGFACSVDGAATPCGSPFSFTLASGAHTFSVAAQDAAGNVDPTPATRAWTIGAQVLPAPGPADVDRDGVTVPTDCVDTNAAIKPGAVDTPGDRIDQNCDGRDASFVPVTVSLTYQWRFEGSQAWLARFVLKSVSTASTVTLKCTGPKRACTFKSKTIKGTGKDLDLRKLVFKTKRLRAGAVVTLEVTAPNAIAKVTTFKVRKGKAPSGGTFSCRVPGATKLTKCT